MGYESDEKDKLLTEQNSADIETEGDNKKVDITNKDDNYS